MPAPEPSPPGRYRRVLGQIGVALGLTFVFAAALVGSVALHLDLGPTRRTVRLVANQIFASTFKGKLVLGEIDRLNLSGLAVRRVDAFDPRGALVLHADGLSASTDVVAIAESALFGSGDVRIAIPRVRLRHADFALEKGPDGVPTIAEVFVLQQPPPPPPPDARKVRLSMERIEIDHVWAHGAIAPPTAVDADLSSAVGRVEVSPDSLLIEVAPTSLAARAPLPKPLASMASFRLLGHGGSTRMETKIDGKIGDVDLSAEAALEGTHVSAKVNIPRATPEVIASFIPGEPTKLPLRRAVSATVEAEGDLPDIAVRVKLGFEGGGAISADGKIAAKSPLTIDATVGVHAVDPRVALDFPSATPVDASGKIALVLGESTHIDAEATTQAFEIAGNLIPGVDAKATFDKGVWSGSANVHEPGVPAHGTFSFEPKEGLRFEISAKAASLAGIRRVPLPVEGAADVKVKGTLKEGALDAKVSGNVGRVRAAGGVELQDGHLEARLRGPLATLDLDATVTGKGVRAGTYAWDNVTATARGPVLAPRVEATLDTHEGESLSASGDIDARSKSIKGVHVDLKRKGQSLSGEVERVAATAAGLSVEGIKLGGKGVGQLDGGLLVQGKELVGKLHGSNVDLAKVAELAGLKTKLGGLANLDIDLGSSGPGQRRGHVQVELVNGEVDFVSGISGSFSATFNGDRVRTDGLLRLVDREARDRPAAKASAEDRCDGAIAQVRVSGGDGHLPGPLLDPATWTRAFGKVEVAADDWNVHCLAKRAGLDLFVSEVRGKLSTRVTVERAPGARLPKVRDFLARTRGLAVVAAHGPGEPPEWDSRFTDVEIKGSFDPASGVTSAKITLLDDAPIASLRARAVLDVPLLLDHPERLAGAIRRTPISGRLSVPRRAFTSFASLPSFVRERLPMLGGEVKVDGELDGTLDEPNLVVKAEAWDLAHAMVVEAIPAAPPKPAKEAKEAKRGRGGKDAKDAKHPEKQADPAPQPIALPVASPWGIPLGISAVLRYDGKKATLDTHVIHNGGEVASADAELAVSLADLLAGRPMKPAGSLRAKLDKLPLAEIPYFSDRGVSGLVSGSITLGGLGDKPFVKGDVRAADLKLGPDLTYDRAEVKLDVNPAAPSKTGGDPRGAATASVELSSKVGGRLSIDASSEVIWPNGLGLKLDEARPANLTVRATKFRVAAAAPFVAGVLSRLDGVLHGEARLGAARLSDPDAAKIAVRMKLEGGVFHVPQLGQELHDAQISLSGGNNGLVQLDTFRAAGQKGLITGKGQARFDGLRFVRADASFSIKPGSELPVTLEGVPLGDARGDITISAAAKDRELAIDVGVPSLHIDLPAAVARSVQPLDDNPDVTIKDGQPRVLEPRSEGGRRVAINVDLGRLGVKGTMLDITLTGQKSAPIRVELGGEKARVSGDISLPRGRIDVLKKQFEIEQGIIHLRPEDPGNPYVNVTARWDSPEGPIYIDYVGVLLPITPAKLKYRSPSIPEDRILPTLLFGGVEQSTVAGGAQGQAPGQSLAAQLIAEQFTTQLSQNASFNLGAREDGTFRPGITYTAGDAIIELSTYGANGGSGASTTTGAAAPKGQHSLITIDWRFWRNWTLRGKVDVGSDAQTTGLDVLWQYRY